MGVVIEESWAIKVPVSGRVPSMHDSWCDSQCSQKSREQEVLLPRTEARTSVSVWFSVF